MAMKGRPQFQRAKTRRPVNDTAAWNRQIDDVMIMMVGLPVKVLREEYNWDDTELETMATDIADAYHVLDEDNVGFVGVLDALKQESNINLEEILREYSVFSNKADIGFMLACGISVMLLLDNHGYTDEQAKEYAEQIARYYRFVKSGYLKVKELTRYVQKHTGMTIKISDIKQEQKERPE